MKVLLDTLAKCWDERMLPLSGYFRASALCALCAVCHLAQIKHQNLLADSMQHAACGTQLFRSKVIQTAHY